VKSHFGIVTLLIIFVSVLPFGWAAFSARHR
jgi:hypothetical protein